MKKTLGAHQIEAEKVLYLKDNTTFRGDNLGSNAKEHPSTSLPPISGFCYRSSLISPSNYHKYGIIRSHLNSFSETDPKPSVGSTSFATKIVTDTETVLSEFIDKKEITEIMPSHSRFSQAVGQVPEPARPKPKSTGGWSGTGLETTR